MLKDITLGRYYCSESLLHHLDPRTKLFSLLCFVVSVFVVRDYVGLSVLFLILSAGIIVSKVPIGYMLRGLKSIAIIVLVADAINIFSVPDGLSKAIVVTLRMVLLIFASNLLTLTTKPKDIADGIEKSFSPLNVHSFATMVSIAFRFIPILTSEAEIIMNAQKSRGADFEHGSLVKRTKALVSIIIPLFVSSFRRADDLAMAMDSRLYGTGKASRLHPLKYRVSDWIVKLLALTVLAVSVFWRVYA